jgi:hypothetical protein
MTGVNWQNKHNGGSRNLAIIRFTLPKRMQSRPTGGTGKADYPPSSLPNSPIAAPSRAVFNPDQ